MVACPNGACQAGVSIAMAANTFINSKVLFTDVTQNALFIFVGTWACPVLTLNCTETEADVTLGWDTASRCPYRIFGFDWFAQHHLLIQI